MTACALPVPSARSLPRRWPPAPSGPSPGGTKAAEAGALKRRLVGADAITPPPHHPKRRLPRRR